jgi:cysteine desulfurase
LALAVGLVAALEEAVRTITETCARINALRCELYERIRIGFPDVMVNGPEPGSADSLPTVLNLSFPGHRGDLLLMALDLSGVSCSTGSACSSGSLLPSPVLKSMGISGERLISAVRFTIGWTTTQEDIEQAATRIVKCLTS